MIFYNNIERLFYFYHVCSYENFSRAAEALKVHSSTVSKNISLLEDELGVKLFNRQGHSIELSQKGHIFLNHVKIVINELNLISGFNEDLDTPNSRKLKVNGGENALTTLLISDLKNFYSKNPRYLLDITASHTKPNFYKNNLEVALSSYIDDDVNLIQNYIATFNLGLYASREYLDNHGVLKSPQDLDNHKLIVFENYNVPFNYPDNWALNIGKNLNTSRQPNVIINSVPMTVMAAKLGLGIAAITKESFYIENSDLIEVLPTLKSPQLKVYYTYHEYNKSNSMVNALKEHIENYSKSKGWF